MLQYYCTDFDPRPENALYRIVQVVIYYCTTILRSYVTALLITALLEFVQYKTPHYYYINLPDVKVRSTPSRCPTFGRAHAHATHTAACCACARARTNDRMFAKWLHSQLPLYLQEHLNAHLLHNSIHNSNHAPILPLFTPCERTLWRSASSPQRPSRLPHLPPPHAGRHAADTEGAPLAAARVSPLLLRARPRGASDCHAAPDARLALAGIDIL